MATAAIDTDDIRPSASDLDDADDLAMVDAARSDPARFEPLYRRYADSVYRYCWRRLGDGDAAADATSLVFTRALAGLAGFHGGSFRAWLFTIAHNVAVNHRRDARVHQSIDLVEDIAGGDRSPEESALATERSRSLARLVARLPEDYRTAIELRLAGLTGPEIARVMGRSHTAVRLLQHRALLRLRQMIEDEGE